MDTLVCVKCSYIGTRISMVSTAHFHFYSVYCRIYVYENSLCQPLALLTFTLFMCKDNLFKFYYT